MYLQDSEGKVPMKWCLPQDKLGPRKSREPTLRMKVDAHRGNPKEEMEHWWWLCLVSISATLEQI